jgi:hypothetical protein
MPQFGCCVLVKGNSISPRNPQLIEDGQLPDASSSCVTKHENKKRHCETMLNNL